MRDANALERTADMLTTALGEQIADALSDPTVIEIMTNPDGRLWIERHGEGAKTQV